MDANVPKRALDLAGTVVDSSIVDHSVFQNDKEQVRVSGDGVFYTLQGEGQSMGCPAVFLRLHHCNLDCSWCDTWYTWDQRSKEFWTESMLWTAQETRKKIEEAWGCRNPDVKKRLVITGGEPLMQQKKIVKMVREMPTWDVEIETNGTIMPDQELLARCQFNCSPKLAHSNVDRTRRIKKDVLEALNQVSTVFKFVVKDAPDLEEMERDFIQPFRLSQEKILIMPEGVQSEEIARIAYAIVEEVKVRGYRLLGRLQCEIWGAKRSV
ncbi:MAG TPA: 7-carboxy-7-deazaguanine synthase QueE [Candidatus Peribacteraceae bacterium]|nr:7-carboxy-7-deazaguanine synthase QueE [Candidatus Peribacteraceae bacterium]